MKLKAKIDLMHSISQISDFFISSWLFMVGVGATHLDVWENIPTISFWQAMIVVFTIWQVIPNGVFGLGYLRLAKAKELELK